MKNLSRKTKSFILLSMFSISLAMSVILWQNPAEVNSLNSKSIEKIGDKNNKIISRIPLFFMGSYALIQKFVNKSSEK